MKLYDYYPYKSENKYFINKQTIFNSGRFDYKYISLQ